jgi:glycosyltransferase involved in cell wall biosynthesis
MSPRTLVIVAAHDEADRVGATLAGVSLAFPDAELWLADDGSIDGTAQIAAAAGARVVRSERVLGKGGAVTGAAREALSQVRAGGAASDAIFVLCDGDLGDSARELVRLVEALDSAPADLAVGAFSRRVGGGVGLAVGFARWAIQRRCGLLTRAPISGQRAIRADTLAAVLPFAPGFGMEVGMTIDAVRAGGRVVEVELDLDHRATGRTPAGFLHRGRQLVDFVRVYLHRR